MLTPKNESTATNIFKLLQNQYTVSGSDNTIKNVRRREFFKENCNLLNSVYDVPENYCPFFWDDVACWNATPSFSTIQNPCVTWAMSELPPPNTFVERQCLNGTWENLPNRTLEMLYYNCSANYREDARMQSVILYSRLAAFGGYCISAVALVAAIFLFWSLRKLRCGRNWIHFNLFTSFLLRCIVCAVEAIRAVTWRNPISECTDFEWNSAVGEKLLTALWNYAIISSYGWVLIEGLYLFNSIYFNVFKESPLAPYVVLGWTVPAAVVFCWGFIKANWDNTPYWVANCNDSVVWALRGPLIAVSITEVILTIGIMCQLHSKVQDEIYLNERARYRKFARSFFYLLLSIGGSYLCCDIALYLTSFLNNKSSTYYAHCIYIVINSLYGVIISVIYCFNNGEVRDGTKLKLRKLKQNLTNIGLDFQEYTTNIWQSILRLWENPIVSTNGNTRDTVAFTLSHHYTRCPIMEKTVAPNVL